MELKIKRNLIGSQVYHAILNRMILIEEGKEEFYYKLGMDVFVKPRQPKLNVKSTKKRNNNGSSNSNGTNND